MSTVDQTTDCVQHIYYYIFSKKKCSLVLGFYIYVLWEIKICVELFDIYH